MVEFISLTDARRAFERGHADAWVTIAVELLQSRERSARQGQAFIMLDFSSGADVIVARAPVARVAELCGNRVAAEPETMDVILLHFALKQAGMSLADVHLIGLPQNQTTAVFACGGIDAAVTYPPDSVEMLRSGIAREIFNSSLVPGIIIDVLAADATGLQRRKRQHAAVMREAP